MHTSDRDKTEGMMCLVLKAMNDGKLRQMRINMEDFYTACNYGNLRVRSASIVHAIQDFLANEYTSRTYGDFLLAEEGQGPNGNVIRIVREQNAYFATFNRRQEGDCDQYVGYSAVRHPVIR